MIETRDPDEASSSYNTQTRQPVLYIVSVFFIALTTLAVGLRFLSRRIGRVRARVDDILILCGWVFSVAFYICIILDVRYGGTGLHITKIMETDPHMSVVFSQLILPVGYTWMFSVVFSKLAVLSLYLSIFSVNKTFRYTCYITGVIIALNCIGAFCAGFATCIPLHKLWDNDTPGHCFNLNDFMRWVRLAHIGSDVVILLLPIPHVLRLQTTPRMRVGLLVTFALGSLGFIFGIICWVEYFITDAIADKTWSAVDIFIWSIVESGSYLIAACLLSYHPLMNLIWRRVRGTFTSKSEESSLRPSKDISGNQSSTRFGTNASQDGGGFVRLGDEECLALVDTAHPERGRGSGGILVKHEIRLDLEKQNRG
ncbi:hypothetical protein BO71DRAFT_357940 [Aspergillus ellipticus CBS 707.79]|uniref:Rhodopsin domain-containing protein n=1 Tax=Aspergillus ellipticus CBS 707.79 TaxID=1448320 RepID=A0A319EMI5_9EURO|nr:hypothetical protein BO71DRAFT_357940 [Aspergillus ellipticus CBS 707.79]